MASKPRNFNPDYYYHVFNRAIGERRKIFLNDRDYQLFVNLIDFYRYQQNLSYSDFKALTASQKLSYLRNLKGSSGLAVVVAFAVMPNHFHLLLKPVAPNARDLSFFIANLTNSYTRYFNRKYQRSGSLFQGTFKAKELNTEGSILQVSRYLHLNPVASSKANPNGKLKDPGSYPYSSYPEWVGIRTPHITDVKEVQFWTSKVGGPDGYRKFVEAKLTNPAGGIENLVLESEP